MGLLSDFYIADPSKAAAYDTDQQCAQHDYAQYKRLSLIELSTLWAHLSKREWDSALIDEFPQILFVDEGERTIFEFPPSMVQRLAGLSLEEAGEVSAFWAGTEEIASAPEQIRPVIDDLVRLARRSIATNRRLYVWNCV